MKEVEEGSIQDYIQQAEAIVGLHQQIVECDSLLGGMERMLQNFQSDLGSISSEILSLQQQSVHMNIKLKNRQSIRGDLTQFVDEMAVPEDMILTITGMLRAIPCEFVIPSLQEARYALYHYSLIGGQSTSVVTRKKGHYHHKNFLRALK